MGILSIAGSAAFCLTVADYHLLISSKLNHPQLH